MAHNFALRARKLAWSFHDEKQAQSITQVRRVGTDSTLNDDDDTSISASIKRIQATADVSGFVSALKMDGCVIVENFTTVESLQKASEEVKPWLNIRDSQPMDNSATPLIKQSPIIRNRMLTNDVYQELCDEFLTVETTSRKNNRPVTEACQPILSSAKTSRLQPMESENDLYRYDSVLGRKHEQANRYQNGRDSMLGLIIPSSETIRVHAMLGSHLFGSESLDIDEFLIEEDVKPGEALIVLGSLYHYIAPQSEREADAVPTFAHAIWSCSGVYRPEEQSALTISAAELKTYPKLVRDRLR